MKIGKVYLHKGGSLHHVGRSAVLLGVALLLVPCVVQAADVTVGCSGGTPGTYSRITAALNFLDVIGPHTITVSGTCREDVLIMDRDRVTIESAADETATIRARHASKAAVRISKSRAITLRGLEITGGRYGVLVDRGSRVLIQGTEIWDNARGLWITRHSNVVLGGTSPEDLVQIHNNTSIGIKVTGGSLLHVGGGTSIQKNEGFGVGVSIGGIAYFYGSNTIEENSELGVNVAGSAAAHFEGPTEICNNGTLGLTGRFRGGVRIGTTSRIQFNGTEISNNKGPGVYAELNSAVAVRDTSITNNTEDGIRVIRESVGFFSEAGGNIISGNGGPNISCDSTSLLVGVPDGISNIKCLRIERGLGPPRPGAIVED